jgi:hypothetical protein
MQSVNILCCKIVLQRTDDDKWEFLLGQLSGSFYFIEIVADKGRFYVLYQGLPSPTFFPSLPPLPQWWITSVGFTDVDTKIRLHPSFSLWLAKELRTTDRRYCTMVWGHVEHWKFI